MNDKVYIYGIYDDKNNIVRYVGKSKNPKRRLYSHIYNARNNKPDNIHLSRFINKIIKNGNLPKYIILEECNNENWKNREIYWIAKLSDNKLCNRHIGGIQPPDCTGRKLSKKQRQAISKRKKGVPIWNNNKHPMLGKVHPAKGQKRSKEFCELMQKQKLENNGMKGVKLSNKRIAQIKEINSKKIALINKNGEILKIFKSQKEASEILNLDNSAIGRVCKGEYKHTKGYKFKWL